MKKNNILNLTLLILSFLIIIFPLALIKNSEFNGADGKAEAILLEINPQYEPWFSNFWEPPGPEVETLLFSIQAAIGSGLLFFGLGYFIGKRDNKK